MDTRSVRVILASKSPRRRELLAQIIPEFDIITADADETLEDGVHPRLGVEILAVRKGEAVAARYPEAIVISSDTLVELDGVPLGKPEDEDHAARMLRSLSGRSHNVHTGVAVHYRGRVHSGVDSTAVVFRDMSDEEIRAYIATFEPMDKAGAYAIQGEGGKFVLRYDGNFDTVVGLSIDLCKSLVSRALECEHD